MKHRFFVYGTLGPGKPNEHVLAKIGGSWSEGSVRGCLRDIGWGAALGFPALVLDAAAGRVHGHIFESDNLPAHWAELDLFEGNEYRRVQTKVETPSGHCVDAYIYVSRHSCSDADQDAI